MNFFTFFLLPFMLKPSLMRSASDLYSKANYWFENFFYLFAFMFYELFLIPFVYLKVIYNIIKVSMLKQLFFLLAFWLFVGPIYLIFAAFKDAFYFIKILIDIRRIDY